MCQVFGCAKFLDVLGVCVGWKKLSVRIHSGTFEQHACALGKRNTFGQVLRPSAHAC